MKKITLLILLVISTVVYSQSGWEVVFYGETYNGNYYRDITFPGNQTGWLLCQNHMLKTTDGGSNWKRFSFRDTYSYLPCFYFASEDLGWVVENNYLHVTSNGGESWEILDTTISDTKSINMRGIIDGWRCGNSGMIKKTTNGGYNWVTLNSGTTNHLNSIAFANFDIGACAGDWGTILSTTNGGLNWIAFYDPFLGFFDKVSFLNSQTGFVSGTGGNVYVTTNSGLNWTAHSINSGLISCIRFLANDVYAFGRFADIYKSTDLGNQWQQIQSTGLNSIINSAAISSNSTMWVAADSGQVYRSTNSALNWNEIYRDYLTKEDLNSIYFLDNNTGFTCGNRGRLFRSVNGGLNWVMLTSNTGYNYTGIRFTDNNSGYVCGGNGNATGIILKTINSGLNWQVSYQDSAHFNSIFFINIQTGWATGARGLILKTTNAGNNWVKYRHQFNSSNLRIFFINENTGFLTKSSTIYKSTNGGVNWINNLNALTAGIQFFGQTGFASAVSGSSMLLYKTTNEGSNWIAYSTGGTSAGPLYFINPETGWISGGGSIRKTTNGGINWVQQESGIQWNLNSIYFSDNTHGWTAGTSGGIMRTVSGGIGINPISNEIPQEFYLLQNYPNPFNPVTKFRFQLPVRELAKLVIYDALGRQIAVILNEILMPGTYEIEWNASDYSSGVYFYSLVTNEFTQSRKMIVLK
jgi:photosystem II stability/assembly factor-like uncharacterized protein